MLWLLPWVAVALGLGSTSTVATYFAIVHFGLIERVATFALRRGLRGLTLQDAAQNQPGYRVTRLKMGTESFQPDIVVTCSYSADPLQVFGP